MPTAHCQPASFFCGLVFAATLRTATAHADETKPPPAVFEIDPVSDTSIILGAAAFAGILDLINATGEIRPQQISRDFDRSQLLRIDRDAISQTIDPDARSHSNVGLGIAVAYAVLDPILSGLRMRCARAGFIDATLYAEAMSLTWGVTNLAKVAVRRPRPDAYIDAEANRTDPDYANSSTDSSLSFFSGHASMTASVSATATYLAFARSPGTAWPWATLGAGAALTTYVSVQRVRAGAHFPTDVIAGSIAGAGIGALVTHLHHVDSDEPARLWIGLKPEGSSGGVAQVGGVF